MLETYMVAMTTFFATIGPLDVTAVFTALTVGNSPQKIRAMAIRGCNSTTNEETDEASHKSDISVFPLATPLIAGPGAMGASILLMAKSSGDHLQQLMVVAAIISIMVLTLSLLLISSKVQRLFGITGMHVITRVFGVLLSALAVQFMIDGILGSGLIH